MSYSGPLFLAVLQGLLSLQEHHCKNIGIFSCEIHSKKKINLYCLIQAVQFNKQAMSNHLKFVMKDQKRLSIT